MHNCNLNIILQRVKMFSCKFSEIITQIYFDDQCFLMDILQNHSENGYFMRNFYSCFFLLTKQIIYDMTCIKSIIYAIASFISSNILCINMKIY